MIAQPGILGVPEGLATEGDPRRRLRERLGGLASEGEGIDTAALVDLLEGTERSAEEKRDALSTRLMEIFRVHRSRTAFGLLYELNGNHLLQQVVSRLRRYQSKADPNDILQEVFVNVYRYPHRFNCEREDAFRVWTATIVRNTVLKHLRSLSRSGRAEVPFDDLPEPSGPRRTGPFEGVVERESRTACERVYVTYLQLYLRFYRMLSQREQRAIHLVEVEGSSYRAAAEELGIKLENLKMVIFRARRKIHRSMRRVFEGLPPDLRPARDPIAPQPPRAATAASAPRAPRANAPSGARPEEDMPKDGVQ